MTENQNKPNFWTTLPGILTGIAALLTAVGGLWVALRPPAPQAKPEPSLPKVVVTQPPAGTPQPFSNSQQPAGDVPPQPSLPLNKPQAIITENNGNRVTVDTDSLTWIQQKEIALDSGQSISLDRVKTISVLNVGDSKSSVQITLTSGKTINDSVSAGRYSPYFYALAGNNDTGSVLVKIDKVKQVEIQH